MKRAIRFSFLDIALVMTIAALICGLMVSRWKNSTIILESLATKLWEPTPSLNHLVIPIRGSLQFGKHDNDLVRRVNNACQDLNKIETDDNPRNWEVNRVTLVDASLNHPKHPLGPHCIGIATFSAKQGGVKGVRDCLLKLILVDDTNDIFVVDSAHQKTRDYVRELKKLYE